jgi:hypothetical protein
MKFLELNNGTTFLCLGIIKSAISNVNTKPLNKQPYSKEWTMSNTYLRYGLFSLIALLAGWLPVAALAHGVDESTRAFLLQNTGIQIIPFLYIGAKHMVTGYDHLLFLIGILFFLYKSQDILLYVSLFTLGHSLTLLFGVLNDVQDNAYLIDAIMGLSVV